ncbi:hypothetical protein Taro_034488 [Colocasia esculenta]|uniref:DYW domain-containing protein n=1 Tax=Colocasia esculenta TaxID=4460 RepID=A0A843W328_COLES|nr:hypothetical protein [Colocasia esculenta]
MVKPSSLVASVVEPSAATSPTPPAAPHHAGSQDAAPPCNSGRRVLPPRPTLSPHHFSPPTAAPILRPPPCNDHAPISTRHPLLAVLARCRNPAQVRRAHALLVTSGLVSHPFVASKLVHLLVTLPTAAATASSSSLLDYAGLVLRHTPSPTLFTYNTLIRAYSDSFPSAGSANPCLLLFRSFLRDPSGPLPNQYTFVFALNSCCRRSGEDADVACLQYAGAGPRVVWEAEQVRSQALQRGLEKNLFVCNVLIKVYGSWGRMEEAVRVFSGCTIRDLFSWNTLLSGYLCVGKRDCARKVFDEMPSRDVVTWSTIIAGYVQFLVSYMTLFNLAKFLVSYMTLFNLAKVGSFMEAMELFHEMQMSGVTPNEFTLTSILAACANLVALDQGTWVHFYIKKAKIRMNEKLLASLIDMYAKCGEIDSALKVFNEEGILKQTVWPWNAMLSGFAIHGKSKEAIDLFEKMKSINVAPNKVTFVSLLSACSHGSFLDEARFYFKLMKDVHGIDPQIEHYGCMVDLFGRAGLLKEAEDFISVMPMPPDVVTWSALLSACRIHKDIQRAGRIGKIIRDLEPEQVGCQVLLANIYSGHGRWTGAKDIRNRIKISGTRKSPGCSSIELHGMFHQFLVGDRSHPQTKEIYSFLDDMGIKLKNAGYEPEIGEVLVDIDEEDKETALSRHSEKLAIAFGLMNTPPGTVIRIVKNLRVCLDCHHATKFISKIYDREIIVRDRIRFHHFRGGLCSCKDYW